MTGTALAAQISAKRSRITIDGPHLTGSAFATDAARYAITESRRFRLIGESRQASHYLRQAGAYRRQALILARDEARGAAPSAPSTVDWHANMDATRVGGNR